MNYHELLLLPENFIWAWRKARRLYRAADNLFDQGEVAAFDLDLEAQLSRMRREFRDGHYSLQPLKLLPQPKKPDTDGTPRLRQSFQVSVRDQVAWIAVVNVIGPLLDQIMPPWSYGHRLYRAVWYERDEEDDISPLTFGPYRHSSGRLYRNFQHSWPLFRRHLSLTSRMMIRGQIDEEALEGGDRRAWGERGNLNYLAADFWRRTKEPDDIIYTASVDLAKFYPKISLAAIKTGLGLLPNIKDNGALLSLIEGMLDFIVDPVDLSDSLQNSIDPPTRAGKFEGIPTGLMVAGFLSNVAMLPVDQEVQAEISARHDLAHFQFVDDHIFLAFEFEKLCDWIRHYRELLKKFAVGPDFSNEKYAPERLGRLLFPNEFQSDAESAASRTSLAQEVKEECEVDGKHPSKLMTTTLAQVSVLAGADFDVLTDTAKQQRLEQLEWLLLANLPDDEIRADTRAAFAAGRIAKLAPSAFSPSPELVASFRELKSTDPRAAERPSLESIVDEWSAKDRARWKRHVSHYYDLLFRAFAEHPDKVRLFNRLLDYCRTTGHPGFQQITDWMKRHRTDEYAEIRRFLGALALHELARSLPRAAADCVSRDVLHNQRIACLDFLRNIETVEIDAFLSEQLRAGNYVEAQALNAFIVSLNVGALIIAPDYPELSGKLTGMALRMRKVTLDSASRDWRATTGYPIGVWTHWAESLLRFSSVPEGIVWDRTVSASDPKDSLDWNNIRRFPSRLPHSAWLALQETTAALRSDDAGWLLEAANAAPTEFARISSKRTDVVRQVRRARAISEKSRVSLLTWASKVREMPEHDPRRSEWTALEVIRQLVEQLLEVDVSIETMDKWHPANILLPREWLNPPVGASPTLTWENWRRVATENLLHVGPEINDYRFQVDTPNAGSGSWPMRLRLVGQLLWCLLRKNFELPPTWNIRGQERALIELVNRDIEELPISSRSLAILKSCLLPRSAESAIMLEDIYRQLFGIREAQEPNDTAHELLIHSPNELLRQVKIAQRILVERQVTVLSHQPRQLVPVRIDQIGDFSEEADQDEINGDAL